MKLNTEASAAAGEEQHEPLVELTAEQQQEVDTLADADMAAGFAEASGDAPPAAVADDKTTTLDGETKTGTEAAAPAAASGEVKEDVVDPWEGVHPTVRAHLEKLDKLPDRLRNIEGHIGGLKSAIQPAIDAAKAASAAGKDAPTGSQITSAAASGEKWKQLKEDFPEWADAAEERFGRAGAAVNVDEITTAATKAAAESVAPTIAAAVAQGRRLAVVDIAHEGWEQTINTASFKTWLDAQPEPIKALAASDVPKDAIKLLDGFKAAEQAAADKAAVATKTKNRLAAGAPVKSVTVGGPPVLDDESAFTAGFNGVRKAQGK